MDGKKLIHTIAKDGRAISFNPDVISMAQAGDTLTETIVMFVTASGMAQFFVKEPHTMFIRKWEAALNGKIAAEITN